MMNAERATEVPVLAYASLLRQSHALIAQGMGDSPEAEELADQMDAPWSALTLGEQQRMRGLAADLNVLLGGRKPTAMSADQLATWRRETHETYERSLTGEVDTTLKFLRKPVPETVSIPAIQYLQARSWERLGDLETALFFLREAEREDPSFAVSVLTLLQTLGDSDRAIQQADRIVGRSEAAREELYLAARSYLAASASLGDPEAAPLLQKALGILSGSRKRPFGEVSDPSVAVQLDVGIACGIGLCQERLGNLNAALRTYDDALKAHPFHPDLLTMRGLARYVNDRDNALADFLAATRARTRSVWPLYILARHALANGAYGEALQFALKAADLPGPRPVRAEIFETIGVAYAQLGQKRSWVIDNLKRAVDLDPSNQRLRRILQAQQEDRPRQEWGKDLTKAQISLDLERNVLQRKPIAWPTDFDIKEARVTAQLSAA